MVLKVRDANWGTDDLENVPGAEVSLMVTFLENTVRIYREFKKRGGIKPV